MKTDSGSLVRFIGWNDSHAIFVANHYTWGGEWDPEIVQAQPGEDLTISRGWEGEEEAVLQWADLYAVIANSDKQTANQPTGEK